MKNKKIAKILSLLCLMGTILSCDCNVDDTPNTNNPTTQVIEVNIENGIADWNDFITTAGSDFSTQINNFDKINGFKGYATYTEIEAFFASQMASASPSKKRYETPNLQIFFDAYPTNEENNESDITPSVLNKIFTHFTNVNITGTNNSNGSFEYIKISSGNNNEIFDINKFYERLSKGEFSINGIPTQSENTTLLLGIDDKYLSENLSIDIDKLTYLLQNKIFQNALIDKVILSGNISGVETLYPREAKERNITFTDDAYSTPREDNVDTLTLPQLAERQIRGFKMILSNTNIKGDDSIKDNDSSQDDVSEQSENSQLDFSNAKLNNITFTNDTDLSTIPFNNVVSKGNLVFEGILPTSIKYLNAENVIFNNAVVPPTENAMVNITALRANSLIVNGKLSNEQSFISDANAPKGEINDFKGSKKLYDTLIKILNIKNPKIRVDIVKILLQNNQKQYI